MTHLSDLSFAREKVLKDLKKNKNRRLSALFRDIRKIGSVSGIGDFPIMSMIIQTTSRFKSSTQKQIWLMCKQSEEYRNSSYGEKLKFSKSLIDSINY